MAKPAMVAISAYNPTNLQWSNLNTNAEWR